MRNRVLGAIGVLWGGLILLRRLAGGGAGDGAGAYGAGQTVGLVFAGIAAGGGAVLPRTRRRIGAAEVTVSPRGAQLWV